MPKAIKDKAFRQSSAKVKFDKVTHTYTVGGKKLPSVTQIMRPLSEQHYADIPHEIMENARQRGTRVHEAIEIYDMFGAETDDKEIRPYLVGYRMAQELHKFHPKFSEQIMACEEYCGTVEIIAKMKDDLIIIDLKATSKINFELLEVQLAGYMRLARENNHAIERTYVLQVKPYAFRFVEILPNYELFEKLLKEHYEQAI